MIEDTDSPQAGDSLSIDQAAAAFVKATTPKEVQTDQPEVEEETTSDDTTDDELQASSDASEEDDGETTDEDHAEEGDDEPESEQGRFVADNARVKLPDGTFTTVAELKSGSLRNADYTRKTQEVAEQRKAVETQSAAVKASMEQIEQQREYNIALLKSVIPPEPDISMLDINSGNFDVVRYNLEKAQREQLAQHLNYLEGQQQRTAQERQAKASETERETADREWNTLLEKVPSLKDPKRVDSFIADIRKAGEVLGYTPAEMKVVALDHRHALALEKAAKWDKLQASKANVQKKVENRPPVSKGGKRLNPSEHRARAAGDAMKRLQSSGSEADAVAAYLANRKTG